MAQIEYIGQGALQQFATVLSALQPKKIFLVVGPGSYAASGAKAFFDEALKGIDVREYNDFHAVLEDSDVQKGVAAHNEFAPDIVVAVGGGHVLDAGKAINYFATKRVPLVAVPTTAGSGAEATPFAVIYKDGVKQSLEGPKVLPTHVIVDPALARAPRTVMLPSALDALCQAVESYWAKGATPKSRTYAREALSLIWLNIDAALAGDDAAREALCRGSNLAGKAIAISKTTSCHALSYGLTYRFKVPHGVAVAVFLPTLMRFNGVTVPRVTSEGVEELLRRLEVPSVAHYGVTAADISSLAAEVNVDRLSNNPRQPTKEDIINFYTAVI